MKAISMIATQALVEAVNAYRADKTIQATPRAGSDIRDVLHQDEHGVNKTARHVAYCAGILFSEDKGKLRNSVLKMFHLVHDVVITLEDRADGDKDVQLITEHGYLNLGRIGHGGWYDCSADTENAMPLDTEIATSYLISFMDTLAARKNMDKKTRQELVNKAVRMANVLLVRKASGKIRSGVVTMLSSHGYDVRVCDQADGKRSILISTATARILTVADVPASK